MSGILVMYWEKHFLFSLKVFRHHRLLREGMIYLFGDIHNLIVYDPQ